MVHLLYSKPFRIYIDITPPSSSNTPEKEKKKKKRQKKERNKQTKAIQLSAKNSAI
jgi:hypothetical protein